MGMRILVIFIFTSRSHCRHGNNLDTEFLIQPCLLFSRMEVKILESIQEIQGSEEEENKCSLDGKHGQKLLRWRSLVHIRLGQESCPKRMWTRLLHLSRATRKQHRGHLSTLRTTTRQRSNHDNYYHPENAENEE